MTYNIIIDGQYLDVPTDFKLTLKYNNTNLLLINQSYEQDRTNTFALSITEHNRQVLQLIDDIAIINDNLNKRYNATLQLGSKYINGIMYIDSINGGNYNCVLVGVDKYPKLGAMGLSSKIDTIQYNDYITIGDTPINATDAGNKLIANIKYNSKYGNTLMPAINLKQLLHQYLTARGVASNWSTATLPNGDLWAIMPKANMLPAIEGVMSRSITGVYVDVTQSMSPAPINTDTLQALDGDISMLLTTSTRFVYYDEQIYSGGTTTTGHKKATLTTYIPLIDIIIGLPEDMPADWFVGTIDGDGLSTSASTFYGGYEFSYNTGAYVTSGTPLAGRKIEILKGQPFTLLHRNDYTYSSEPFVPATTARRGWTIERSSEIYNITIEAKESKAVAGDIIRLQDNLPNISVLDLYLTICACNGICANINNDTLNYNSLDSATISDYDLSTNIIGYSDISNTCFGMGVINELKTQHESWTNTDEYVDSAYISPNINLESQYTIYELPFADGARGGTPAGQPTIELRNELDSDCEYFAIGRVVDGLTNLQRVKLDIDDYLMQLLTSSRRCTIKALQANLDIDKIMQYKQVVIGNYRLLIDNIECNNGIVNMTCQLYM